MNAIRLHERPQRLHRKRHPQAAPVPGMHMARMTPIKLQEFLFRDAQIEYIVHANIHVVELM